MKRYSRLLLYLSLLINLSTGVTWMTNVTGDWTFECPVGQVLKTIVSIHTASNGADREWNFTCESSSPRVNLTACEWSVYSNEFRDHLDFQCHNDDIIVGISSYFDSSQVDRRYKFRCCTPAGLVTHACTYTPFLNQKNKLLSFRMPDEKYLRGFHAEYVYPTYPDRLFFLNICKLDKVIASDCCF